VSSNLWKRRITAHSGVETTSTNIRFPSPLPLPHFKQKTEKFWCTLPFKMGQRILLFNNVNYFTTMARAINPQ